MAEKGPISLEFTEEEKAQLAEYEEKHGRIYPFRVKKHGLVVFRKPLRVEWRKYRNDSQHPSTDKTMIVENLAKKLALVPDPSGIDRILDDYPGLIDVFESCFTLLATGENTEVAALGKDWKEPDATT